MRVILLVLFALTTLKNSRAGGDPYKLTDGTLQGAYEFYQEVISWYSPFGSDQMTRSQQEMMVPAESKLCVDRTARCELVMLQLVPGGSGRMWLQADLLDSNFNHPQITIDLESDLAKGTLIGEKLFSVDEANLTDERKLSRISFTLHPYKNPSGLVVPMIRLESEAVSRGSFGGVFREKRTHQLMRAVDKED